MEKQCELYDRVCTGCNECNICELDNNKLCDNCCKCIDGVVTEKFKTILIDGIITDPKKQ